MGPYLSLLLPPESRRGTGRGQEPLLGNKGVGPGEAVGLRGEDARGQRGQQDGRVAPHGGTALLRVSHHPATRDKAAGKKNLPIVLSWPYFVPQAALPQTSSPLPQLPNAGTPSL